MAVCRPWGSCSDALWVLPSLHTGIQFARTQAAVAHQAVPPAPWGSCPTSHQLPPLHVRG